MGVNDGEWGRRQFAGGRRLSSPKPIALIDGRFQNAQATAKGNTVVITSPIEQPVRVRHAWKDNPTQLNAYAKTGLPVGPFEQKL